MNQTEVRRFVERYFAAFSSHVMETHPAFFTVKLPMEVDKDIGNRPFYWSWMEKMNLPPQPMILTFLFDPEQVPEGIRGEPLHFGAGRLQQIFRSVGNHGRFVCLYELPTVTNEPLLFNRRSTPLTPWLGINVKVSFICDKKRDLLLYLGIDLNQPRIVHNFYPYLRQLTLSPAIPDYFYTRERTISMEQTIAVVEQEVKRVIDQEDSQWAEEARERLAEELEILEAYYHELALRGEDKPDETDEKSEKADDDQMGKGTTPPLTVSEAVEPSAQATPVSLTPTLPEVGSGRILDFLRMNSIPETPKNEIDQTAWRRSSPQEERERRQEELRWQYEPRIEVKVINAGLFYLHNAPPFSEKMGAIRKM